MNRINDREFDQFVEESVRELDEKQAALEESYQLGRWEEFFYDAPRGTLQFKDKAGRVRVQAETLLLGTYSASSGSWRWAWANESLPADLRQKSEPLKELADVTGVKAFKLPKLEVDETMAWELPAMCVRHLGAQGCYRMPAGPQGQTILFVAIQQIESVK